MLGVPTERFGPDDWWRTKDGFVIYFSEYVKLAAYWCAYGNGFWYIVGLLVLFIGATWFASRLSPRRLV